jgi:hypothetical protein
MEPQYQPEVNPPVQPADLASNQYLEPQSQSASVVHSDPPPSHSLKMKLEVSSAGATPNEPHPIEQTGPRPADQVVHSVKSQAKPGVAAVPATGPEVINQQAPQTYNVGPESSTAPSIYSEVNAAMAKAKVMTAGSLSNAGPSNPSVPNTNSGSIVAEATPTTKKTPTIKKPAPKKPLSRAEKRRLQKLKRKMEREAKKKAKAEARRLKKLKAKQRRLAKKKAKEARRRAQRAKKANKARKSKKPKRSKSKKKSNKKV